jgi:hypothetical protein
MEARGQKTCLEIVSIPLFTKPRNKRPHYIRDSIYWNQCCVGSRQRKWLSTVQIVAALISSN